MGLSRGQQRGNDTPYVQTRFYRAPEVVALCEYDQRSVAHPKHKTIQHNACFVFELGGKSAVVAVL